MITKEFSIKDLNLKYYVGINQIKFNFNHFLEFNAQNNEIKALDLVFQKIGKIQRNFKDSVVQFFNDNYVVSQEHVFTACYFVQKAFYRKINISNGKNIEFLLYLSALRQIKNSIDAFGISIKDLKTNILSYCVITPINNLDEINEEIIRVFNANEIETMINEKSLEKYDRIKNFFNISRNQIKSIINSYGIKTKEKDSGGLETLFLAMHDLICEKMALLSLEKA